MKCLLVSYAVALKFSQISTEKGFLSVLLHCQFVTFDVALFLFFLRRYAASICEIREYTYLWVFLIYIYSDFSIRIYIYQTQF